MFGSCRILAGITLSIALFVSNMSCAQFSDELAFPAPLVDLNGTSYYFEPNLLVNWFAASDFCRRLGLFLVSVETAQENALIQSHMATLGGVGGFWSSGADLASQGAWVWTSTGRSLSYKDWESGEPSGSGNCTDKERALAFLPEAGFRWGDSSPFSAEQRFVCEQIP